MKTVFVVTVEHEGADDIQIEGSDAPAGREAETFEGWLRAAEVFGHRKGLSFSVSTLPLANLEGHDLGDLIESCDGINRTIAGLVNSHEIGAARTHLAGLVSAAYKRGKEESQ